MTKKAKQFDPKLDISLSRKLNTQKKKRTAILNKALESLSNEERETFSKLETEINSNKYKLEENRKPAKNILKTVVNQDGKTLVYNVNKEKRIKATAYKKTEDEMSFIMPVQNHEGFYISGKLSGVREYKKLEEFTLHKK